MISQVAANVFVVDDGADADRSQYLPRPNARKLEDLRRTEDTSREDDLVVCSYGIALS